MPKLDRAAYQTLLNNLRKGYEEFQKEDAVEYKQFQDLAAMDSELSALLGKYTPDKTEFSEDEMNEIDASYEKIQTSYKNITQHNTVMNLHARDMLEGFLEKVDPEEYQAVQSKKTPVKPNTTNGNYVYSGKWLSTMASFANFVAVDNHGWAPYKRMQELYMKLISNGLVDGEGYDISYGGDISAKHYRVLKKGETTKDEPEPAENGLAEFETTLREYEATLQDYLNCDDIKENPMMEALANSYLGMVQQTLAGEPVTDQQLLDSGHTAVQDCVVNYRPMEDLKERQEAQAGMKGSLWVEILNLDTQTHKKTLEAMSMENRDPHSPEQITMREELIEAYKAKEQLILKQAEAFKNPDDPNYKNLNRLMRDGMKDHLHEAMDLVGPRGFGSNGKSTKMLEALESGWPLQELATCRQLLAYRDFIRSSLEREDLNLRKNQSKEFVQALENMEHFLGENIKTAYDSPEKTENFMKQFGTLRNDILRAPCTLSNSEIVYSYLANACIYGDQKGIEEFTEKLESLSKEAVKVMNTLVQDKLGDDFRKGLDNAQFLGIAAEMKSTDRKVWFGSKEFKRIGNSMKDLGQRVWDMHTDAEMGELPTQEQLKEMKDIMEARKKDIDTYIRSKEKKTKFTEVEKKRLDLVREAKKEIEKLEKTLGIYEKAVNEVNQDLEVSRRNNAAIGGKAPDWDVLSQDVKTKIKDKVSGIVDTNVVMDLDEDVLDFEDAPDHLDSNIDEICRKGSDTMKAVAGRIDQEKPENGKVKLSPEEAKDLCVYSYLRGISNTLKSDGTQKMDDYCRKVVDEIGDPDFRKKLEEGVEKTQVYRELTEQGVDKAKMRDMVASSAEAKKVTTQVINGMEEVQKAKLPGKVPEVVKTQQMEVKQEEPAPQQVQAPV